MGILTEHSEHSIVLNVALTLTASAAAVLLNHKWTKIRKSVIYGSIFSEEEEETSDYKEKYFHNSFLFRNSPKDARGQMVKCVSCASQIPDW